MHLQEYQAKRLLRAAGIPIPCGRVCVSAAEVVEAVSAVHGPPWVVKAQILAGGRGAGHFATPLPQGGGVRLCESVSEVRSVAAGMLGNTLITRQTGEKGQRVRRVYIEQACEIARELYLSLVVDRSRGCLRFVGCAQGGMAIEELAKRSPEKISQACIDPMWGVLGFHTRRLAHGLRLEHPEMLGEFLRTLHRLFVRSDAELLEINPLVLDKEGKLVALDAKMTLDDSALFRHPDLAALQDPDEEEEAERQARRHQLSYVKLHGNIGCLVNGAGLAMATMDLVQLKGGAPANFLDIGGGADQERVAAALRIILSDKDIRAVLINIFGGIVRCDVLARGIVEAARQTSIQVPLVVRLEGTNVAQGREIFAHSDLPIVAARDFEEAARKAVAAAQGAQMQGEC